MAPSIVSGNTDIAVADFDYAAAFPWFTDGVPDTFRAAAEWAHDALGDDRVAWLRRLPAERRLRADDGTMVVVCHASPGSQTSGFDQALDPSVTIERVSRTDARVIACGHTHLPEIRDLGWKLIVNDGSAGYVFDGDPTASWARIDIADGEVQAEIQRTDFDVLAVANAISARGLPGDVYRAAHGPDREAGPMRRTAARRAASMIAERRAVVVTGMGMVTALGNDVADQLGRAGRRSLRRSRRSSRSIRRG